MNGKTLACCLGFPFEFKFVFLHCHSYLTLAEWLLLFSVGIILMIFD
jgi:hypothetical protein